MTRATVLNDVHRAAGAKMVDFGGWDMPIHYGSQIEEHHQVRRDAGMFDVSHMTVVDIEGASAHDFLRRLVANSVDKLKKPGKALYTCMLNEAGGVIDDLIVYFRAPQRYRLVVNAATRDKDLQWINAQASDFDVRVEERPELAMIAVQGPNARARVVGLLPEDARATAEKLGRFAALEVGDCFVARTGYTGEDGFELTMPADQAADWWGRLHAVGVRPAGLGARDTLRLEAGMNLYGQDMDETVSPLEAGLAWTVAFDEGRAFVGRSVLEQQREHGAPRQLIGAVMDDKGVLRHGQRVQCASGEGEVLSGTFSPTLGKAIAMIRVPAGSVDGLQVDIRGRWVALRTVALPFVREGKIADGVLDPTPAR
ncbi:MAG: glycine cleavage system aminomethyltransferase GcvT [Xanthomonadales bacterium]|nr:glycine cleavage system aminomethyltransferase GcvT [Xanthomonadales bacterium]